MRGCFALLGTGSGAPLHSADYDFNDDVLGTGVEYYVDLVRTALAADKATPAPEGGLVLGACQRPKNAPLPK